MTTSPISPISRREVKIAFNKPMHHPRQGTYYRGCFTLDLDTFIKFVGNPTNPRSMLYLDPRTKRNCYFLNLMGRDALVDFLRKHNIPFNANRAFAPGVNYYIDVRFPE